MTSSTPTRSRWAGRSQGGDLPMTEPTTDDVTASSRRLPSDVARDRGLRAADRRPGRELPARAARDRPRGRRRPGHLAAAARDQPGAARRRPARRAARLRARERVPARRRPRRRPRRACGCGWPSCSSSVDTYSFVFDPYVARGRREPALRRPDQHRHRPRERPAPLPRRRHRRGAVVVAVLLRLLLGQPAPAPCSTRCCRWSSHDRLDADVRPASAEQVAAAE